jgi:heme a synthase
MAYGTSREWLTAAPLSLDRAGMRSAAFAATGVVYVQLLLGALMRHLDAGLAIPDFPLAFGRLLPPLGDPRVAVHFAHRVGAVFVLVAIVRLYLAARRNGDVLYGRPARVLLVLITAQIGLGASVIWTGRAVYWTTAHVATGAAVLGTCFFVALRAHRHLRPADAEVGVPTARALPS